MTLMEPGRTPVPNRRARYIGAVIAAFVYFNGAAATYVHLRKTMDCESQLPVGEWAVNECKSDAAAFGIVWPGYWLGKAYWHIIP